MSYVITESPTTTLTLSDIFDEYAANIIGVEDINTLSGDEVRRALRRFDGLTFLDEALGFTELYERLGQ